eukprot:EG_transcript_9114
MFRLQSFLSPGPKGPDKGDAAEATAATPDPSAQCAEPVKPLVGPASAAKGEDLAVVGEVVKPPPALPASPAGPPAPAPPIPAAAVPAAAVSDAAVVAAGGTAGGPGPSAPADTRITCALAVGAGPASPPPPPGKPTNPRPGQWVNLRGDVLGWYFQVAALGGVPLRVHPFLVLLWVIDSLQGLQYGVVGAAYFCFVYGPALWSAILVHELGHVVIALACGYTVDCILLWPLGGLALIGKSDRGTPLADLKVAVAGPLTHVPQLVVFAALAAVYGEMSWRPTFNPHSFHGFWPAVCNGIMMVHVILFLFNICFPCYPLDGGRALVAILLLRGVQVETAARVSIYCSFVVAIVWSIYAIVLVDVFVILLMVWIGLQVFALLKVLQAGKIREHPMFCNVPPVDPKAVAVSAAHNPLQATPRRTESMANPNAAVGFVDIFGGPKADPPPAAA